MNAFFELKRDRMRNEMELSVELAQPVLHPRVEVKEDTVIAAESKVAASQDEGEVPSANPGETVLSGPLPLSVSVSGIQLTVKPPMDSPPSNVTVGMRKEPFSSPIASSPLLPTPTPQATPSANSDFPAFHMFSGDGPLLASQVRSREGYKSLLSGLYKGMQALDNFQSVRCSPAVPPIASSFIPL